jgi:predicted O-methyltransferase YrrM
MYFDFMTMKTKLYSLAKLLLGDDEKKWVLAEKTAKLFNKKAILGEYNKIWLIDHEFVEEARLLPCNNRQLERLYVIKQIAEYCSSIEGDFAECGTYLGSSAFFMSKQSSKKIFLFDSWEGLSQPAIQDGTYWKKGDLGSELSQVKSNLRQFDNVVYLKGWIPSRFNEVSDRTFSFVHIDVDIYEPTKDSIGFFWERLTPGGILICDDYGFVNCPGAKKAMDDFFSGVSKIISLPTGQGMVIKGL